MAGNKKWASKTGKSICKSANGKAGTSTCCDPCTLIYSKKIKGEDCGGSYWINSVPVSCFQNPFRRACVVDDMASLIAMNYGASATPRYLRFWLRYTGASASFPDCPVIAINLPASANDSLMYFAVDASGNVVTPPTILDHSDTCSHNLPNACPLMAGCCAPTHPPYCTCVTTAAAPALADLVACGFNYPGKTETFHNQMTIGDSVTIVDSTTEVVIGSDFLAPGGTLGNDPQLCIAVHLCNGST